MFSDEEEHLQHFQAPHRSEGSVFDAADVVFIQLTAENTKGKDKETPCQKNTASSHLTSTGPDKSLFPDPPFMELSEELYWLRIIADTAS